MGYSFLLQCKICIRWRR